MPFLPDGNPELSPKQMSLMRLCRERTGVMKLIGVFGTRLSGKTVISCHCIADHLWNTKDASVLVLCSTAGSAATSGVWNELTEKIIPEWIAQGFGSTDGLHAFEWEMEPKIHGSTKKMIGSIRNKHGGISKIELDSLDDEREVEKKFKSRYYSMIYWSEAGEFRQETTFTTLAMALRIMGLPDDEHILIVDANPPDNGTEHFLYKFFYQIRIQRDEDFKEDEQWLKIIKRSLLLTEWTMDDNPFVSDERKALVKGLYKNNPAQYDRYILGLWTKVVKNALFADSFMPATHCASDLKNPQVEDELIPEVGCSELITGWDVGFKNPVTYVMEKVYREINGKQISIFKILDELEFVGEGVAVDEFTMVFLETKVKFWETECGGEIDWVCWSDSSACNFKESIANRTVSDEVYAVSDGKLKLIGVDKGKGSVGNRIRLLRKLLNQNRILISNGKCPKLVDMLQCIGRGKVDGTINSHSEWKHFFDALTYALSKELWDELQDEVINTRRRNKPATSELVTVRL